MKRKYADFPNWDKVLEKDYKNRYFDNNDFKGNISLLTVVKVKKQIINEDNIISLDNGFKWLEIYPENNKNVAVSVCINNKDKIIEWYFDIAKNTYLTEQGVPYIEDLYLDVILTPDGKIKVIDQDELQEALDNKDISMEEFDLAYKVANNLIEQIEGKTNQIIKFTKKYLKSILQ